MVPQYIPFPILILNSLARENIEKPVQPSAYRGGLDWFRACDFSTDTGRVFIRGPFIVRYPGCPNSPAEVTNFVGSVRWPVRNQSPVAALHGRGAAFGP